MVAPDMVEVKLVKPGEFEDVPFISEQHTATYVSLWTNSVARKTEIKPFKMHVVPFVPVTPPEHAVNTQNEISAQKIEIAFTMASCGSVKSRSGNGSSKRRSSIRISSKSRSRKGTSNIRISSKSRSLKRRSTCSKGKIKKIKYRYWQISIAIGLCCHMLPVVHALPESRKAAQYGSLTTCCFKWQRSTDHIVKVNGEEVGMCNHVCHKTEEEAHNGNISLTKVGTANILMIKTKSCTELHVTYVLTGGVVPENVPLSAQSGDNCEDKPKNAGNPAINITNEWTCLMIIALISSMFFSN